MADERGWAQSSFVCLTLREINRTQLYVTVRVWEYKDARESRYRFEWVKKIASRSSFFDWLVACTLSVWVYRGLCIFTLSTFTCIVLKKRCKISTRFIPVIAGIQDARLIKKMHFAVFIVFDWYRYVQSSEEMQQWKLITVYCIGNSGASHPQFRMLSLMPTCKGWAHGHRKYTRGVLSCDPRYFLATCRIFTCMRQLHGIFWRPTIVQL